MINQLCIYSNQVLEFWKKDGFSSVLNRAFSINKGVVVVENNLNSLASPTFTFVSKKVNAKFIEVLKKQSENAHPFYSLKSRYLKMLNNLDKGYKGFAIVKGDEVIGDIWYASQDQSKTVMRHSDLKLLNINLSKKDSYMFDMYVKPEERGFGTANFLLWNALNALKQKGFERAYGYYMADNIPALWVHRTLGYKELNKFKVHRILFLNFKS